MSRTIKIIMAPSGERIRETKKVQLKTVETKGKSRVNPNFVPQKPS